jgi:hypothetical protein
LLFLSEGRHFNIYHVFVVNKVYQKWRFEKFLHDHRFPSFCKGKSVLHGYWVPLVLSIVVVLLSEDLMWKVEVEQEKSHSSSGLFLVHVCRKFITSAMPFDQ